MSSTTIFNESAPATECVSLPITVPRETATPIIDTLFTGLATTPGFISGVWGYQLEDPTQNHWFLSWETLAAHVALTQTPAYVPFVEKIQTIAGSVGFVHAGLQRRDVLDKAPVLEWITVWLKEETDKAEWVKGLGALEKTLQETAGAKGYYGLSSGWVKEETERYDFLLGWESLEAHKTWKAGMAEEELGRTMAMFRNEGVEKVEVRHVKVENRAVKA